MRKFEVMCEKIIMDKYRNNILDILEVDACDEIEALNTVAKDLLKKYESEELQPFNLDDGTLLFKYHKKTLPNITFKLKVII